MISMHGFASGRVQGVGFRFFVKQQAQAQQLTGFAKNLADGRVEFILQGDEKAVLDVVIKIRQGPRLSRVDDLQVNKASLSQLYSQFTTG